MSGSKIIADAALKAAVNLRSSKIPSELAKSSAALFSAYGGAKPSLPDLKYDYGALEPAISTETMTLHHTKHHQTYINNLIAALDKLDSAVSAGDVSGIIALQAALRFNGGGHVNHTLFWENLSPKKTTPTGPLEQAINESFGSFDKMKEQMSAKTLAVQGSGWGWLGYNKSTGRLEIVSCPNQDPLEATTGLVPLMGIDIWEHAFYVDYRNDKATYVKNIWDVLDFEVAAQRLMAAKK